MSSLRVGVLVSGRGSNLQAIIDSVARGDLRVDLSLVISNRSEAPGLERARRAGIPTLVVDRRECPGRDQRQWRTLDALEDAKVELVALAGFDEILQPFFVERFQGRIINIHPSLLPAFGGTGMVGDRVHAAVLASGSSESGCSVHLVTEDVDMGPVLVQRRVPVLPGDTVGSLAARVLEQEHLALPEAIRLFAEGSAGREGSRPVTRTRAR